MAMKKSTKKLLKIAGVVTAVVGIGYLVLKDKPKPKKEVDEEPPPGPGEPGGPPGPPLPGEPDEPELPPVTPQLVIPQWDADARLVAEEMMAAAYAKMGSPPGSFAVVVSLANVAATQIWPNWVWPNTEVESAAYEGAGSKSALVVWQNLTATARELLGLKV